MKSCTATASWPTAERSPGIGAFAIGRIDRLGRRRRFAKGKSADAPCRALDGVGDLFPAPGITGGDDGAELAHHLRHLAVEQPEDLRRSVSFSPPV